MIQNLQLRQRLPIVAATVVMLYLFFHQVSVVLRPIPIAFDSVRIAYGYSSVAFSGTVYKDQGVTAVSLGSGVALHINGAATSTTTTNASGEYSFTGLTINQDDIVTVFIDNENADGVLVGKFNDSELSDESVTGMDIYADRLILRSSTSDRNITTTDLDTANDGSDTDIDAIYSLVGSDLQMGYGKELYIWSSTTHTTSGSILTHDLEVLGTLNTGTGNITASGSVVIPGTLTTSGSTTLTSVASGETLQANGTAFYNLYIDSGMRGYFRMDEGVGGNASGATLNTSTGASLFGPTWVQTNTGTTVLLYNPYALEFDGVDDYADFGDNYDLDSANQKQTFALWVRRKSSTTEDVIFSKQTGSGATTDGYILYIDDTTDKVVFEARGTAGTYTVTSNTSITDENWHHIAVSYNQFTANEMNIFIDGAIDVSAKSGTMPGGTIGNTDTFRLGLSTDSEGPFIGTMDDLRIYNRVLSGSEISSLYAGEKTTGSGTYNVRSDIDVNGDFCAYAGILDVGTGHSLNVKGDFCAYGGKLRTNSGSVVLDGDSQAVRGSTAFNQLTKSNTSAVTLTFEVNTLQSFSGTLIMQGALSNQITIVSSRTGSQAYLVRDSGATVLKYLDVQDNNALSGGIMSCTEGCIDSDNTNNWEFLAECGDGIVAGSEQCDDGNSSNTDSCPNDCRLAVCGDNVVEGLEECEPPNSGTCLSNCLRRSAGGGGGNISLGSSAASFFNRPDPPDGCGNGLFEPEKGEECDTGERFNGLGTCSYDCKNLRCGDGIISPQIGEDCEPKVKGTRNGVTIYEVATCGETCTAPEVTPQGTAFGGCHRIFLQPCGAQSSSAAPRPSAPAKCGNGIVDAGEECDFGGLCQGGSFDGSFWTDGASATTCISGGGTPMPSSGDGCSETCTTEFCGDGVVQERGADNQPGTSDDEQCDNGSVCSDTPSMSCRLNSQCGQDGECRYNEAKNRTCSSSCKQSEQKPKPSAPSPVCGNSKVESGEECDLGPKNGEQGAPCTLLCTRPQVAETPTDPGTVEPRCGDGIVQGQEECDDGAQNSDINTNACRTNCSRPRCGDFVVDTNEQCDNGDGNSDNFSDTCRTNCMLPVCGDGITDSGEECDGGLSCTPFCRYIAMGKECGNGVVEPGEQCDDGNTAPDDGCSAFCQREEVSISQQSECGNGVVEPGEQCDDGNTDDTDACSAQCRLQEAKRASAPDLVLDADIVVVNPDEYANALKFLGGIDPCSVLVIKGMNQKAIAIRAAANRQGIPIVRNIALAREIYASVRPGEKLFGDVCLEVNKLKPGYTEPTKPAPQPLPQAPTQFAYGFYNYAQVQPMITSQPPAGETGPGLIGIALAGAAGGMGWIRRRKR